MLFERVSGDAQRAVHAYAYRVKFAGLDATVDAFAREPKFVRHLGDGEQPPCFLAVRHSQ
jgi:hypothetical protein